MVWIVKKGISCLLILLGVTFVTFALMYLAGGDAISYRSRSGFVTYASGNMRRAGSHGGDPAPSEGTLYPPSARSRWRRIKAKKHRCHPNYDGICAFLRSIYYFMNISIA